MRKRAEKNGISVHAIAGSHVVLLGIDAKTGEALEGLLGFAIKRIDNTEDESYWLKGFRTFEQNAAEHHAGTLVSTWKNPIQDFLWGDYTAKPGHEYVYVVVPIYGKPSDIRHGPAASVTVSTEDESGGVHAVFFNRAAAGSQAYARRFGNLPPDEVGEPAFRWLSRGLAEAMVEFIGQAAGGGGGLRAAVYEFSYLPVLGEFRAAIDRGADVRIVYDDKKRGPGEANREALRVAGIEERYATPRKTNPSFIAHNKFIVLLEGGRPTQVWTGSTNITEGGIFGHSNVGHIVRDRRIAAAYLEYWKQLSGDPEAKRLRPWNDAHSPLPGPDAPSVYLQPVFSSRGSLAALEWYAEKMESAKSSVFFTAAFGVNELFRSVLEEDRPYLRYVLLDKPGKGLDVIARDHDNRISVGGILDDNHADRWLHAKWKEEALTGLNRHVQYVHTKYMLIDPLGDDPMLITGSANFSENSTVNNDENMLVIRGNTRVADIYLGEFMRLFDHFRIRGSAVGASAKSRKGKEPSVYLAPDGSWVEPHFKEGHPKQKQRLLFR